MAWTNHQWLQMLAYQSSLFPQKSGFVQQRAKERHFSHLKTEKLRISSWWIAKIMIFQKKIQSVKKSNPDTDYFCSAVINQTQWCVCQDFCNLIFHMNLFPKTHKFCDKPKKKWSHRFLLSLRKKISPPIHSDAESIFLFKKFNN